MKVIRYCVVYSGPWEIGYLNLAGEVGGVPAFFEVKINAIEWSKKWCEGGNTQIVKVTFSDR